MLPLLVINLKSVALVAEATFPPFSTGNVRMLKLGDALKKEFRVHLFVPAETPRSAKVFNHEGIIVHQYPGFGKLIRSPVGLPLRMLHVLIAAGSIALTNASERIHFIHAWNPIGGLTAAVAGALVSSPVFVDYTDVFSDFAKKELPLFVPCLQFIEEEVSRKSTRLITVSNAMKRTYVERGIDPRKIFVVPDGTDEKLFNPSVDGKGIRKRLGLGGRQVTIFIGDAKYSDGVDILARSFKQVAERKRYAKLLIVGQASNSRELRKLARDLNLEDSIVFVEPVKNTEIPQYIAAADVGVMPLRNTLNNNLYFSFKLFEYWATGKPVVVSRVETISTVVKNGKNGLLVEPENERELADALLLVLKDPVKAKKMGAEGRKLVEKKFNWSSLMTKEASICEKAFIKN